MIDDATLRAWVDSVLVSARAGRNYVDSLQQGAWLPIQRQVQAIRLSTRLPGALHLEELVLPKPCGPLSVSAGHKRLELGRDQAWQALPVQDASTSPLEIRLAEPIHLEGMKLRTALRAYRQRIAQYSLRIEVQDETGQWMMLFAPTRPVELARQWLGDLLTSDTGAALRRTIDIALLRLSAAFADDPDDLHARMAQVQADHFAGDKPGFKQLYAELLGWAYPLSLGNHGMHQRLGTRDAAEVLRQIAEVVDAIATLGWPVFVNSGTLLGLVRGGALLPHDDDVDLALILPVHTAAEMRARRDEFTRALTSAGLTVAERPAHWKIMRLGIPFDVFPGWVDDGGQLHVYPYCNGQVAASDVLPCSPRAFGDAQLMCPNAPERLLEVNYGPGWRQPDPTFKFDWKLSRKQFRDLFAPPSR